MKYYCHKCFAELEELKGCGSLSYFCPKCKSLVSRSKKLTEEERKKQMEGQSE